MVGVAQLVEPRIVAPVVVGSNPIAHPIKSRLLGSLNLGPRRASIYAYGGDKSDQGSLQRNGT